MALFRSIRTLYERLFERQKRDAELDAEIKGYFAMVTDRYMARGLSKDEAQRAARVAFEGMVLGPLTRWPCRPAANSFNLAGWVCDLAGLSRTIIPSRGAMGSRCIGGRRTRSAPQVGRPPDDGRRPGRIRDSCPDRPPALDLRRVVRRDHLCQARHNRQPSAMVSQLDVHDVCSFQCRATRPPNGDTRVSWAHHSRRWSGTGPSISCTSPAPAIPTAPRLHKPSEVVQIQVVRPEVVEGIDHTIASKNPRQTAATASAWIGNTPSSTPASRIRSGSPRG